MKAWELILDQVDWSEVVQETGWRENPDTYRDIFKIIIYSYIEDLLKWEEYGKDMKIELGKRDNKDTDTESRNNSNEDSNGDSFRYFEDNIFLESNKSRYRSKDYIDNKIDNEEDSDDKDQVDNNSEVIDNWVSV